MDAEATVRPRFKSCVKPVVDTDDGLFLLCEGRFAWMPERIYKALAPMLNGNYPVESIFSALADDHAASDILGALDRLHAEGYLADDTIELSPPVRAFWEHASTPPSQAAARLQTTAVSIRLIGASINEAQAAGLADCLRGNDVRVQQDAELVIVVTDDYLNPELQLWNREALANGQSWLLVKPFGLQSWTGPAFVPGQSACWQCLAQRLRWHRRVECYLAGRSAGLTPPLAPPAGLASSVSATLAEVASEVTRWIGTGRSTLFNRVLTSDPLTLERRQHVLVHRPQCPACGNPSAADARLVSKPEIRARQKVAHPEGGGHRAMALEELDARLSRYVSPITGIVGELSVGGRSGPVGSDSRWMTPTYSAEHNFGDMHDERFMLHEGLRRRSGGKGKSAAQARVSALGESLERYSGVFDGTEARLRASFRELGDEAIHPNACMGYSDRQYQEREQRNRRQHKAHWVPEPFDDNATIDWSVLWSLTTDRRHYLPTSQCYFGYRSSDPEFARADSNGCAAGAVMEEAVLQGLLELIERDAVALWWYNRIERPFLDLSQCNDDYAQELQMHYATLERELWVLDITSDVGIPVYAALSRRRDKPEEDIIYGFGAHLDPGVALTRALTEINQSLEAVPSLGDDSASQTHLGGEEAIHWWRTAKTVDHPYLRPSWELPLSSSGVVMPANLASNDLGQDVQLCIDALARQGLDTLVLDQSRPDVELTVVRVVVPGLRHFWARFGSGRLYEVPVRLGWREEPLTETQLNPFVIQF